MCRDALGCPEPAAAARRAAGCRYAGGACSRPGIRTAEPIRGLQESTSDRPRVEGVASRRKIVEVGNIVGSVLWLISLYFNKFLRIEVILGNVD
jgi:hypothetical protein